MLILVVEDEFLINLTASDELVRAGHRVMSAYNADHAIRMLEDIPGIELVFTDIDMPGSMDGLRLAAAVRERWPPVHLIITSGKKQPLIDDLPEGGTFIAKPYLSGGLVDAVQAFA